MPTDKEKITFLCTQELKDRLIAWGKRENRSLSNLCETAMLEAVEKAEAEAEKE